MRPSSFFHYALISAAASALIILVAGGFSVVGYYSAPILGRTTPMMLCAVVPLIFAGAIWFAGRSAATGVRSVHLVLFLLGSLLVNLLFYIGMSGIVRPLTEVLPRTAAAFSSVAIMFTLTLIGFVFLYTRLTGRQTAWQKVRQLSFAAGMGGGILFWGLAHLADRAPWMGFTWIIIPMFAAWQAVAGFLLDRYSTVRQRAVAAPRAEEMVV